MNRAGVLLDTGPIVALLSIQDVNHQRARQLFAGCAPPFRTCEAVLAEAAFLLRRVDPRGPAEVMKLGARGVYRIALRAEEHWKALESLLAKYPDQRVSLADACLIRAAEIHGEPRIATFDADFSVYRWGRTRRFDVL